MELGLESRRISQTGGSVDPGEAPGGYDSQLKGGFLLQKAGVSSTWASDPA